MRHRMDRGDETRSDQVKELAKKRLNESPCRILRGVACQCHDGTLYLHGRLHSYYHKQLAQEAVMNLPGVAQVINEIEVVRAAVRRNGKS